MDRNRKRKQIEKCKMEDSSKGRIFNSSFFYPFPILPTSPGDGIPCCRCDAPSMGGCQRVLEGKGPLLVMDNVPTHLKITFKIAITKKK